MRNLILLVVDALRADAVRQAPGLAALAARGPFFPHCIASGVHTPPSMATLLTGRFPPGHGLRTHYKSRLAAGVPTAAALLRSAGFATADLYRGTRAAAQAGGYGLSLGLERRFMHADTSDFGRAWNGLTAWMTGHQRRKKRFFATIVATQVHDYVNRDFLRRFPRRARKDREEYQQSLVRGPLARQKRAYADAVRLFDGSLARWLEQWEGFGILEDTLLVVVSDHGETLRRTNRSHGFTLFDDDIRVPLIFHGPGLSPARLEAPVRTADVLPTALELLGIPRGKRRFDGQSLARFRGDGRTAAAYAEVWLPAPILRDASGYLKLVRERTPWPDDLYLQCLRTARHKVVRDWFAGKFVFYDLLKDPSEERPASAPAGAEQRRLKAVLRAAAPRDGGTPPLFIHDMKVKGADLASYCDRGVLACAGKSY